MTGTLRNRFALAVVVLSAVCSYDSNNIGCHAFAPPQSSFSRVGNMPQTSSTAQRALPPIMMDHDTMTQMASNTMISWDHIQQSAHLFLSDATAAAAPSAEATGWWGAYINLFKNTLLGLHDAIDGPLRSVGFDQTWGVSIGLFTLLIRSLLIPLSIQQSQSAEYMKALKPYVADIKKKYKNNQDAQNRATAKLYEDANQNPLSGCLLSFAQIPVFLGLYRGVRYLALEGLLDEKFLWIPSLSGPVQPPDFRGLEWLTEGWTNLDGTPTPPLGWETTLAFMIMPVLLVVLQSATMRILQPPVDEDASDEEKSTMETTQTVVKFLPLLIGFFSLQVPAGLTIYWFASNLFTVSQSLAVRAYFRANPPQIELPDYWEKTLDENADFASMTPEERRKASEAGLRVGPTLTDLVDESKFHVYVERRSFREETPAWTRVQEHGAPSIPEELSAWAKGDAITEVSSKETMPAK